ncbi:MAG: pyruvate kinase [Bacteroidota bacterium]
MKYKPEKIEPLIDEVNTILDRINEEEQLMSSILEDIHPDYIKSARNLIHYHTLRRQDLRSLQKQLKKLGMSRFANAQGHIKASLLSTKFILKKILEKKYKNPQKSGLSIKNSGRLLTRHTKELLGYRSRGRRVRIMVTQPTQAADDYPLVYEMVKNGMNCARINCAHDSPEVWEKIIFNVKKAAKALGRNVKITMDLAGPKIRTGPITPGPKVRKFSPIRDGLGKVISPALILLVPEIDEQSEPNTLPVPLEWMEQLSIGDQLSLYDTRDKLRRLKVVAKYDQEVWVNCYDTSYIGTGTVIRTPFRDLPAVSVDELPPIQQAIILREGDYLTIYKAETLGEPAQFDEDGNLLSSAYISCPVPQLYERVKEGEAILFDDGKIGGVIEETNEAYFRVRITRAKLNGSKLKAEKGINFPKSDLGINGLTEKDIIDLEFVAQHADVVNFSFVNTKEDVEDLLTELRKHGVENKLSIILKIETRKAYDNLAELLLISMQVKYVGVMIARGDLAVETGWHHIGRVQQEILSLCTAAHIPVVWATQVLENLAKKGLPSRSEITDATSSIKAECVMLNKGAYINDAIRLLNTILRDAEHMQEKHERMLPQLEKLLD